MLCAKPRGMLPNHFQKPVLSKDRRVIDLGLSYTKASDVFQFSVAASAVHRTVNYATAIDLSSIISDQDDDVARNNDAGFSVTRYFPGKWLARAETRGQQNTELDLDYRILAGLGGGYDTREEQFTKII